MPWPWQKDGLLPLNRRWQTLRARAPKATLRVLVGALILALAAVVVLSKPLPFVVDTTDYAIVTAFGKPTQVITSPGLGFRSAYESLRTLDRRLFVYASPPAEFLTLEKTQVIAAGTVLWRVADPRKFFETVFDRTGAESRLGDVLFAELGAAIGRNPLTGFVSIDPRTYRADEIVAEIARRCREIAGRDYGIEVVDVQLRSFDFPKQNRLRLYARMTSERGRISMQYRSEGEEEGSQGAGHGRGGEGSRARPSDRTVARRVAAKGTPRRRASMRSAFGQAPDFYGFLRTMEASRSLVRQRTTMVLSANSPLFGLLTDSNYFNGGAAGGDAATEGEPPKR